MAKIERSALVMFTDQQMFDLVNDIEAYPEFMNGCVGAQILIHEGGELEARLNLSQMGMSYSFITRNRLEPPKRMTMSLVEGPFKHLTGVWTFNPLSSAACKVILELEFEFSNRLVSRAATKWFEVIASEQVDSLCRRAKQVYG